MATSPVLLATETISFRVGPRAFLEEVVRDAIEYSADNKSPLGPGSGPLVSFTYDGVIVAVRADSDPYRLMDAYSGALIGDRQVGPYPPVTLADHLRWMLPIQPHQVWGLLEAAPPISITDTAAWEQGCDELRSNPWTTTTADFTERWARLMELAMMHGHHLADIARNTCNAADTNESAATTAAAVALLGKAWDHGPLLIDWWQTSR